MNEYYRGTSAYKLEEYESYTQKHQKKQEERKALTKAEQRAFCRLMVMAVMIVFLACSALIYVNVMVLRASTKIDNLEKELALAVDQNKQKEIEINKNLDMKVIEKKAVEKLGMQKPDNSQIVYINVKKSEYSEAVNAAKKSEPVLGGVKNAFLGIVEYFR
ncbi:MAG: hypothetical protein IJ454_01410 [Clostridia bacterium]|nr:hypothetical protein [Clostridia bacterium]